MAPTYYETILSCWGCYDLNTNIIKRYSNDWGFSLLQSHTFKKSFSNFKFKGKVSSKEVPLSRKVNQAKPAGASAVICVSQRFPMAHCCVNVNHVHRFGFMRLSTSIKMSLHAQGWEIAKLKLMWWWVTDWNFAWKLESRRAMSWQIDLCDTRIDDGRIGTGRLASTSLTVTASEQTEILNLLLFPPTFSQRLVWWKSY